MFKYKKHSNIIQSFLLNRNLREFLVIIDSIVLKNGILNEDSGIVNTKLDLKKPKVISPYK